MEKLREADWRKLVGAFIMVAFAVTAMIRWNETHILFFLLLVFRDLIFAYHIATRKMAEASESGSRRIFSYVSTALPLFYFHATTTNNNLMLFASLLSIGGFLISTLATIELGDRIGVAPAKRGQVCESGVYRYIKHPMYSGYVVSELGNVLLNPANILIFVMSVLGYSVRARRENKILRA